jgi:hypothetical protein
MGGIHLVPVFVLHSFRTKGAISVMSLQNTEGIKQWDHTAHYPGAGGLGAGAQLCLQEE